MKAFIFPGQGSQQKGMGLDLFDFFPSIVDQANNILGYDLKELCLEDPERLLGKTRYTQPALFTINALSYYKTLEFEGIAPDFAVGHSLGEYNALLAAKVFSFETGLKLVKKRAELMSKADGGSMAAVIGIKESIAEGILSELGINVQIANYNSPDQLVISGDAQGISHAKPYFEKAGATYITLNVSGAFHSKFMLEAQHEFADHVEQFDYSAPQIPVISNFSAKPYDESNVARNLILQISNPVKWTSCIEYILDNGCSDFNEVGPKKVLTSLTEKTKQNWEQQSKKSKPITPVKVSSGEKRQHLLGSADFLDSYNVKYPYVAGAMYKGIASKELVEAMSKAGFLSFFGSGGLSLSDIENAIEYLQQRLPLGSPYGMNLLCNINNPEIEEKTVDLYLRKGITNVEAAAYMQITPALVRYCALGLSEDNNGKIRQQHRVIAKVSRPEIAKVFLSPAPDRILKRLVAEGKISQAQANLASRVPMAHDLCVEADSGGHTDGGNLSVILPTIIRLRNELRKHFGYEHLAHVGGAGGIGTPESALSAFILGADFIVTGSINQCTIEAGTSPEAKDLLQKINVQDTEYAPAGDMFELGAKVQVLKKGVFFPARANKLYDLYRQYNSLEELPEEVANQIQKKYFKRTFDDVYEETKAYYLKTRPEIIQQCENNPKKKMALVFRWYFIHTSRLAMRGDISQQVDFQVHCGPALGSFNQWLKGTRFEDWRTRSVSDISEMLMSATLDLFNQKIFKNRDISRKTTHKTLSSRKINAA